MPYYVFWDKFKEEKFMGIFGNLFALMPYGMFIPLIFKRINKYYKFFVLTEDDNIKACKLYQKYAKRDEQVLFSNEIQEII